MDISCDIINKPKYTCTKTRYVEWKPCVLVRKCDFLFVFTCNCRCNIAIFSTVIAIRETALVGHINNIATLSANIKFICKKIEPLTSFTGLFRQCQ
jgi:hypothetical protein